MHVYVTMTQKGQITIPKVIRDLFNFQPRKKVKITYDKNRVELESTSDLLDIAGRIEVDKKLLTKYPINKTRKRIGEKYGKIGDIQGRI